jgi:hypothetical protein
VKLQILYILNAPRLVKTPGYCCAVALKHYERFLKG